MRVSESLVKDDEDKKSSGTNFLYVPRVFPGSSKFGSQKAKRIGLHVVPIAPKDVARV